MQVQRFYVFNKQECLSNVKVIACAEKSVVRITSSGNGQLVELEFFLGCIWTEVGESTYSSFGMGLPGVSCSWGSELLDQLLVCITLCSHTGGREKWSSAHEGRGACICCICVFGLC